MGSWLSDIRRFGSRRQQSENDAEEHKFFRLLRFFSWASLIVIVIAAVILTLIVRRLAIQEFIELAEKSNFVLAQATLRNIRPELIGFLESVKGIDPVAARKRGISEGLSSALTDLMRDGTVVRVKIYNLDGTVVFSTKYEQIGESREDNDGFESAVKGKIASNLVYRDSFSSFDGETEDDNLMSTYIPVRSSPAQPIRGVFEIYTNANALVSRNERVQFQILFGVGIVLICLYIGLLLIVRRASAIIESQQRIIGERSETLEMLFSHLLNSEEKGRRNVAVELHEGLAQTLCAIKIRLEERNARSSGGDNGADNTSPIIPELQGAIEQAREIAAGLRPSSLDDLGLSPTIGAFFRNFKRRYPDIQIDQRISLRESDIPGPLKIAIYRIVESAFGNFARIAGANRISLDLRISEGMIVLEIEEVPRGSADASMGAEDELDLRLQFAEFRERTSASGGKCSVIRNAAGAVTLRASWPDLGT